MQSDEAAARRSVEAWLSLIDAGNYSEAYDATGSYFRENVTAEDFRNSMEERLALLGALESRTLSRTQRLTTVPDAPPGDYFVFEFDGVYERRPNARERVTAVSESGECRRHLRHSLTAVHGTRCAVRPRPFTQAA